MFNKNKKKKKVYFSKFIVTYVIVFVTLFILWLCYEMHRLDDLSQVAVVGGGIIALLATVVSAYMWRAKQQDAYEIEIKKLEALAILQEKYPNFVMQQLTPTDTFSGIEDNTEG